MVVETGLGGVRDATNVFPPESLAAAVITTLDAVCSSLYRL
jgi:folylpolyglutamate synthase/dihydropteroate synthase